ncbi:YcnI family protein [Caulobacter soli]|uniref:YcnI family copper-binding membrane protein n=1 Tax=Caulobacter soli TaxID=2708539 RepID=UPI0013EAC59E|nr:YcnI family protein [Caulobacter soli]
MKAPLIALVALLATPAAAHVVAVPGEAKAGSFSAVAFRVGHACTAGDATLKLRVEIPDGVASARPQPKPGWTVDIEKEGDRATAITWTGRLPDDQFDDFALLMKLPPQPGPLVFPAIQTCEKGESQWTEIPDPERPDEKLTRPAPTVRLTPAVAEQMPAMPGMKH